MSCQRLLVHIVGVGPTDVQLDDEVDEDGLLISHFILSC